MAHEHIALPFARQATRRIAARLTCLWTVCENVSFVSLTVRAPTEGFGGCSRLATVVVYLRKFISDNAIWRIGSQRSVLHFEDALPVLF